jgi:PAS domain-containing protein
MSVRDAGHPSLLESGIAVGPTLRTLTDQRRAQAAWQLQAGLLDAIDEAAVATDLEGQVTVWNRAAAALYGWQAEEAVGQHLLALVGSTLLAHDALSAVDADQDNVDQYYTGSEVKLRPPLLGDAKYLAQTGVLQKFKDVQGLN